MPPTVFLIHMLCAGLLIVVGCQRRETEPEAKNPDPPEASGLLRISPEAQRAGGILTALPGTKPVASSLHLTGWLVIPPGRQAALRAPANGVLRTTSKNANVPIGRSVKESEELGVLEPILTPQEQAQLVTTISETEVQLRQSLVTMKATQAELDRLKDAPGAVSGNKLLELQENLDRAKVAHDEARRRKLLLPKAKPQGGIESQPSRLVAPIAGRITAIQAVPGQSVSAGDSLWTIADWSVLWVRVPVFEGDLARIPAEQSIDVTTGAGKPQRANRVDAPQPTAEGQRSVDLFYELPNGEGQFRPGQAVNAELPLGSQESRTILPASAVFWDGQGDAWVYVRRGTDQFLRRRVELRPATSEGFAVERGLSSGEEVVVAGVEVLRGEEFKSQIVSEEND